MASYLFSFQRCPLFLPSPESCSGGCRSALSREGPHVREKAARAGPWSTLAFLPCGAVVFAEAETSGAPIPRTLA